MKVNMTLEDQNTLLRKQELITKVYGLWKTVKEKPKPRNMEEGIAAMERLIYMANIQTLKEFLIDRNGQGEKPRLMVESPYTPPQTGIPEDRVYLPLNIPENHQVILDMLKKQQLLPENSTKDDYGFLFRV